MQCSPDASGLATLHVAGLGGEACQKRWSGWVFSIPCPPSPWAVLKERLPDRRWAGWRARNSHRPPVRSPRVLRRVHFIPDGWVGRSKGCESEKRGSVIKRARLSQRVDHLRHRWRDMTKTWNTGRRTTMPQLSRHFPLSDLHWSLPQTPVEGQGPEGGIAGKTLRSGAQQASRRDAERRPHAKTGRPSFLLLVRP